MNNRRKHSENASFVPFEKKHGRKQTLIFQAPPKPVHVLWSERPSARKQACMFQLFFSRHLIFI